MTLSPKMNHGVIRFVAIKTGSESFGEHGVNSFAQRIEMRNRRSGRGVVFCVVLGKLTEIEVVSTVFHGRGSLQGCIRGDENGEAGRKGNGFLDTCEKDVDS